MRTWSPEADTRRRSGVRQVGEIVAATGTRFGCGSRTGPQVGSQACHFETTTVLRYSGAADVNTMWRKASCRRVTYRESRKSPDRFRCARLTLLELNGEEPETGDINDPVVRPLDL